MKTSEPNSVKTCPSDIDLAHCRYLTSVDVIEALTGLDFLTKEVPDDTEAKIEAVVHTKPWD